MGVLKIKQTTNDGRTRIWKVDSKVPYRTFGASRKAHLNSIDKESPTFEAAVEYREDGWHFITFNTSDSSPDKKITANTEVQLKKSVLKFEPVQKEEYLYQSFDSIQTNGSQIKQVYLVTRANRILETKVLDQGKPFIYAIHGKKYKFNNPPSETWTISEKDGFNIKSRLIRSENLKDLEKIQASDLIDADGKKAVAVTLGFAALIAFLVFLSPKKQTQVVETEIPKTASVVVKMEKKKTQQPKQSAPSPAQQAKVQPKESPVAPPTPTNKVASILKAAVGSRISQLIGKVSATEARTANILVSKGGIKAGEGASGRALSALGKVESSGRNWTGDATASAATVGTAGVGGGRGVASLGGGLGAGKTGSGGVGLIEDESEVTGGLDREVIANYIKTQLGQILYCYERQLSATPNLYGKVAVKFTISGTGQVEAQSINETELKSPPVEGCILNRVAKWKFPAPNGGTKVLVTYPFMFKATN